MRTLLSKIDDYAAYLDACGKEHLKPKDENYADRDLAIRGIRRFIARLQHGRIPGITRSGVAFPRIYPASERPAPEVLVMENVSGMDKGKMKLIFVEILQELKALSYHFSARLMNAMYYGVPQSRQRMIFIGVREDLWRSIQSP